jgi:hypothetical protein
MLARAVKCALAFVALMAGSTCPALFARAQQPGLEADFCYPTRDAAFAAFGKGLPLVIEAQMALDNADGLEIFEILRRPSDKAAVLLDTKARGMSCILIEGHSIDSASVR